MAEEYIVLIVEEAWDPSQVTEAQWTEAMNAHGAFAKAVADAGAQILGGDALQPPSTAVRITPARGGNKAVFTDGPFADMKEVVSGFYKLGVKDAAQARELAALCPTGGWIELYPVMNTGAME
ncbi:MAG TPA: YciI family protein [Galbitalea sp.]|nr:YciI family protein [Galbitalea sp.]